MVTFSGFQRRVSSGGREAKVELPAHETRWLDAQDHTGENIGATDTHAVFIELKEPAPGPKSASEPVLGPR
jgi:hypothetical protein